MTPDSLNPCAGFSGPFEVWILFFKVCFIPKEWTEELPPRAVMCLLLNSQWIYFGILVGWLVFIVISSTLRTNTMIKPSAKTLAIRKAIVDAKLLAIPHVKRAVPVRRPEAPTRWFVALYVSDHHESYPSTVNLEDGTEVDVELFSYDRPSEHDLTQPDPDEIMHIEEAIRKHMGEFTGRRNVNLIAQEGKSIIIGVCHAGMLYEDEEPIPKEIDGIPVIIREGGFKLL